jgi:heme/copper-type cytochrome/quinol oxidase subunit 4
VVDDQPRLGRGRGPTHLLTVLAAVVLALIAFWVVVGVVHALFRLVEVAVVAVVAAYLGYRVGRTRGHHEP